MELRQALQNEADLVVVYVMASNQVNAKTIRFLDELGLRDRIRFARDENSAAIERYRKAYYSGTRAEALRRDPPS